MRSKTTARFTCALLTIVILLIGCAGCQSSEVEEPVEITEIIIEHTPDAAPEAEDQSKEDVFPVVPPIKDADPNLRHKETFQGIPTRLHVRRTTGGVEVRCDVDSLEDIQLDVGHKMIVGTKIGYTLMGDGRSIDLGHSSLGSGVHVVSMLATSISFASVDKELIPSKGGYLQAHVTIFETDVPPQHVWEIRIESGKHYKVLWEKTIEAALGT